MQLSDIVRVVVGDVVRLTDYVGAQFNLRPVMGNPPFGQVSQVCQGVQSQGVGIAGVQYPPPLSTTAPFTKWVVIECRFTLVICCP